MIKIRNLFRSLARPVTVLVIPHAPWPMLRARFTLAFVSFCLVLWTGITLWAGFLAGRQTDYWVTKLDNFLLRDRVRFLSREIGKDRHLLDQVRETDEQMRELLSMGSRRAIIEEGGVGGPAKGEMFDFDRLAVATDKFPRADAQRDLDSLREESQQRLASFQEIAWYIDKARDLYRSTPNIWPAEGHVTSPFGYRFSPFGHVDENFGEFHPGVDIANNRITPILAAADGVVRHAGWHGSYGQMILIDHGHGYATLYGHTAKIAVRPGMQVRRGEVIAYMGTTGRSTGMHLHYEVRLNGRPVNPMLYLSSGGQKDLVARGGENSDEAVQDINQP